MSTRIKIIHQNVTRGTQELQDMINKFIKEEEVIDIKYLIEKNDAIHETWIYVMIHYRLT